MNHGNLLIFNLDRWLVANPVGVKNALLVHDGQDPETLGEFNRMAEAWPARVKVKRVVSAQQFDGKDVVGIELILLLAPPDKPFSSRIQQALNAGVPVILATVPAAETLDFGLYQEFEAHNYELGGLNEWIDENGIFSSAVLQSFSLVHCRRSFPHYATDRLEALRALRGGKALRTLDIGCGPLSKARWGQLVGLLDIVGIDPLNNLYDVVFARHGLNHLPQIRPATTINGFAEDCQFDQEFDFVYSNNALDHTQDIVRSFVSIKNAMRLDAIAVITLNTREGSRQGFKGLHRFDVWVEHNTLLFSAQNEPVADLLATVGNLAVDRVVFADEGSFSVILHRTDQ